MEIRPIRTEADYDWALAEIERYFDSEPGIGTPEADRFDILAALIKVYEDEHYPIDAPDAPAAIVAHLDNAGLKSKDLAEILGAASRASEILNRKRRLTIDMAYKINRALGIPLEVLVKPYPLAGEQPRPPRAA